MKNTTVKPKDTDSKTANVPTVGSSSKTKTKGWDGTLPKWFMYCVIGFCIGMAAFLTYSIGWLIFEIGKLVFNV